MASKPALGPGSRTKNEPRHIARKLLRLRHERQRHFPVDASGPAWDLMLALFDADADEFRLSVGDLAVRADVPRTTTIRWLRQLDRHGLLEMSADRRDKRLVRVCLTDPGRDSIATILDRAGLTVL